MNTEQSRAVVKATWAAFASRDVERIAAMFTEDAEWLAPPENATATALNVTNHMIGPRVIAEFVATGVRRLFVESSVEFRGFYADGNVVVVEERMTSRLPNGGTYVNDYCWIFECRDGLISRMREYMDTLGGHRQIFANGPPL